MLLLLENGSYGIVEVTIKCEPGADVGILVRLPCSWQLWATDVSALCLTLFHLHNGSNNSIHLKELLGGLNELIYARHLETHLV